MNPVLAAWNQADEETALTTMIACCGARRWAAAMVALRPIDGIFELSMAADRVWSTMGEDDWMEAFACHPVIGGRDATQATAQSLEWSRNEQSSIAVATDLVLAELAECNRMYSSATDSPTLFAPRAKAPKRCSASSNGAWPATAQLKCARPLSSNARLLKFDWESG